MIRAARLTGLFAVAGACYLAGAWLTGVLTLPADAMASIRPPNALILGVALLVPPRRWWIFPFATLLGNTALFDANVPWLPALGFALANVAEVGVGLALIWALLRRAPLFSRLTDCGVFVVGAAGGGPMVAATIGAASAHLLRPLSAGFWDTWRLWALGDALALVVLVPVIVLCTRSGWWRRVSQSGETALVFSGLVAVTIPALTGSLGDIARFPALAYAPLPFLFWAALRLGVIESALAVFVFSAIVVGSALARVGTFTGLSAHDAALSMQLLLLSLAVLQLMLAAIVDERQQGAARFRMVFRATPDIITISSLRDGRLIDVNESFERLSGFTREQALGRTSVELGFWSDSNDRNRFFRELTERGRVRDFPIQTINFNGAIQHGLLSSERIEFDGEEALITVRRDITEQVLADEAKARIEEQLQQARKMEAVGRLAGGIAHDFNNLLQAIRGYTEVAASRLPADDPAQMPLEQVIKAADQAATLTTQLLTFSRREALKLLPVDLNAVVGQLVRILRRLIGEHVVLHISDGAELPAVLADRSQVEQVVMNLCINSRDAMPAGGRITIATGVTTFTDEDCRSRPWARPGRWVWMSVADDGSGIPPDVLPQIFEPFFTTKGVDRGTGLGLATVYAVVERHGGFLAVESALGTGTTFTVYFPMAAEQVLVAGEETHEPVAAQAQPGRGETILVAEDDPFVRDLTVEFLALAGYRVIVACDGAEAEGLVRGTTPVELAVLDVAMPHRNGRQVFETIRAVRPDLPVVFTSGYSFGELADLEPMNCPILPKPFTRAALLATIQAALARPSRPS